MSHYKPYPAYKDSGVEWLGKVPEHWEVLPLRAVASVNDDEREQSAESDESIRYIDISTVSLEEGIGEPTVIDAQDAPSRAQRKAKTGDVVLSTVRTYLRAIGQVHPVHEDCVFSTGFAVIRAGKKLTPNFLYSGLLSEPLLAEIEANSKGVSYPAINASEVMLFKLPVPPKLEQVRISEVLQRETARIDALITKKTRFIELLREKRQALITHSVTKGLDPNVKMKDSGVEWLGEVPEDWTVKKLLYWIATGYGSGTTPSDESYYVSDDSGVAWVTTGELRENTINKTEKNVTEHALASHSALKVHPAGSLIIAMYGATIGRLGILGVEATLNQACFAIHPSKSIATNFLRYWFEGFRSELIELGAGGGQPNISADKIRNLVVSAPGSEDEQNKLIAHLDRETARIASLIAKSERSIELLKERRSALITAAVTGQIDLREAA